MPKTLLTVDWDFFFPRPDESPGHTVNDVLLYDWGHREAAFFLGPVWTIRAGSFLAHDLPLPRVNDEWQHFWQRFTFSPRCRLYYGESHARAVSIPLERSVREVWNYDAHHDCGYSQEDLYRSAGKGEWDCATWGFLYLYTGRRIHVRYPRWKGDAARIDTLPEGYPFEHRLDRQLDRPTDSDLGALANGPALPIDAVYVCRSGAWVPPWCDDEFEQFLARCPLTPRRCLEPGESTFRRAFPLEEAEEYAAFTRELLLRQKEQATVRVP